MLDYPSNFDTPAFPAGGRIARSRFLGIGIMSMFLVIACLCGLLVWGAHSVRLSPFMISIDKISGSWTLINRRASRHAPHITIAQTFQESVAGNFFQNWFFLPDVADKNADVWAECPTENCTGAEIMMYGGRRCALSCGAGDELFKKFKEKELDILVARVAAGERWNVLTETMIIDPVGKLAEAGGTWLVRASVLSNINGRFNVIAFVRIVRDMARFPMTLGYYVTDFNAYRVLQ